MKKQKVLLMILPYWTPIFPPQGICRIRTFLLENGYDVSTIDVNSNEHLKLLYDKYFQLLEENIPIDKQGNLYNIGNDVWRDHNMVFINSENIEDNISITQEILFKTFYCKIPISLINELNKVLNEYYQYLEGYLETVVLEEKPGVIGISTFRDTLPSTVFAFKSIKRKHPDIITVMGGGIFSIQLPKGSPNFEFFLDKSKDYIDKIIIGNAEQILLQYLQDKMPTNKKVYTKNDIQDTVIDVTEIKIDYSEYDYEQFNYLAAQTSISCPNKCSFCNVSSFYGDYRIKNLEKVAHEMVELNTKYNKRLFYMLDSLVNDVVCDFSSIMGKHNKSLYWDAYYKIDDKACDFNKVLNWRRNGFYRARIGVESGSQRVLDLMNKNITVEQTKKVLRNFAEAGIKTTAYFVIGFPDETENDFEKTLSLIEELQTCIWEAECNPFTYFYLGQEGNKVWKDTRIPLYSEGVQDLLMYKPWIIGGEPSREILFDRINRFVKHCKRLNISLPWNLYNVNKADNRWKKLHTNAVPSILELNNRFLKEKDIDTFSLSTNVIENDMNFHF